MKITRRTAGLLIILYLTLAGVWAWRLHTPANTSEVAEQKTQREQEHIAAYLAKAPKDTALPSLMRLARMPEDQLQALSDWVNEQPINQIRQLTVQKAPIAMLGPEWGEALLQTWLAHKAPVDLLEVHLMIAAAGDRLNEEARDTTLKMLAQRALSQGDKLDAVTILGRACELPGASYETLRQLTAACRAARYTAPALRALATWINRHQDDALDEVIEEARDMELALMMESDLTAEALSLQLHLLVGRAPYPERTLDRAFLAARRAHQGSRLLPILERHLESFSEHSLSPLKLSQQQNISSNYLRWLSCYAALCDEEQPASVAFAAHLRLAAARVSAALPRLCALAEQAHKKEETEAALTQALEQPAQIFTVLQLAQRDPIARKVLAAKLRAFPDNRELHFSATLAKAQAQTSGSTAILWQEFLRRFPGDKAAQRRLIQAYMEEQQPTLALRLYDAIPKHDLTEEDRYQQALLKQL